MVEEFHDNGKLNTCSHRFLNLIRSGQEPESTCAADISIFIKQAMANEPITIHGDGEQTMI